ncbi:4400_t:CDS:2, partial [Diversispora eburnea]
ATSSTTTTTVDCSNLPKEILLWNTFFEEVNQFDFDKELKFKIPHFQIYSNVVSEEDVRDTFHNNICLVLNELFLDYLFSRQSTPLGRSESKDSESADLNYMCQNQLQYIDEGSDTHVTRSIVSRKRKNPTSDNSENQQNQRNLNFADFKFISILGQGRIKIALKTADLCKTSSKILKEIQKEVKIYKYLVDIQKIYIPKLVCYGYFEGVCYVIGTSFVGTFLNNCENLTSQQKTNALRAFMILEDLIKKSELFDEEQDELSLLLNDIVPFNLYAGRNRKKGHRLTRIIITAYVDLFKFS